MRRSHNEEKRWLAERRGDIISASRNKVTELGREAERVYGYHHYVVREKAVDEAEEKMCLEAVHIC